ncbi:MULTISPECIES: endonuclease domain-containing protein [Streptomyces]|uniref:Endonuclease VII n=2 Tax=Streptomyces alboflavus TaxID=67267 RepID=A0A1Z1WJH7_9ACTN|nr:endonuclease domain-containing protein [Streptomyces alboflavus]ARX86594.1 endonuclease VII [Streptomyces alboflavus]
MLRHGVVECLGCGESKPVSEYSLLNRGGAPRPYCKPCHAERVRLALYGVTRDFLDLLLRHQRGSCAICGVSEQETGRSLHIDHDHACCPGRGCCGACVRGLVCSNCNTYGLAWYEALPPELRTFDLLNGYLANPPAKQLRAGAPAQGG